MIHVNTVLTVCGWNCCEIKCYWFMSHFTVQVRKKTIKSSFGTSAPLRRNEGNKALNGHLFVCQFRFLYITDDLLGKTQISG